MKRYIVIVLLLLIYSMFSIPSFSQEQIQIQSLLSKEQMRNAGLHKLTKTELETLNTYISIIFQIALENTGPSGYSSSSSETTATSGEVIESRISGEFSGWEGETIFKLMNGQIWQQSSYAYMYHYAYMPEVTIYKVGLQYKMQVEGVSDTIYVKRIR